MYKEILFLIIISLFFLLLLWSAKKTRKEIDNREAEFNAQTRELASCRREISMLYETLQDLALKGGSDSSSEALKALKEDCGRDIESDCKVRRIKTCLIDCEEENVLLRKTVQELVLAIEGGSQLVALLEADRARKKFSGLLSAKQV